ncbi:MAG: hypothetical protein NT141_02430 [candidate division WWE3 bacterium]|nr:hypothetical protein [candidate division WWE3 bacterium]
MGKTIKIDYKKIGGQIAEIQKIASSKKWLFFYDNDLDSLYYSPKKIKPEFSLLSLSNEFSIYVDGQSNIGGVFIEYYKANLGAHEKAFRPFINLFTKKIDNGKTAPVGKSAVTLQLSETIKAELLSNIITRNTSECQITIPA